MNGMGARKTEGERETEKWADVYTYIVAIPPLRAATLVNPHGDSDLREENHCTLWQDPNTKMLLCGG